MNACGNVALVAAVALVATSGALAQASDGAKPYTVECAPDPEEGGATVCRVDRGTYVGWRTFHAICHTCHAQDAIGSTFAPDLLARMREIDKTAFMKAMNEGFKGQMGVMPPWIQDPNVNKYFEELWSYLKARSDGALLPGRPKRLPAEP
jgi:cytochrome c5